MRIGKVINDLQDDYELRETSPDMEEDRFRHTDIQVDLLGCVFVK